MSFINTLIDTFFNRFSREATMYADMYGLPSGGQDDARDAFRHAYSSAEATRLFGPILAKRLGDAHEATGAQNGSTFESRNMDWWNNSVGRSIGKSSANGAESASRVLSALNRGALISQPFSDSRRYSDSNPPSEFSFLSAGNQFGAIADHGLVATGFGVDPAFGLASGVGVNADVLIHAMSSSFSPSAIPVGDAAGSKFLAVSHSPFQTAL